jgi:hypothetical protein
MKDFIFCNDFALRLTMRPKKIRAHRRTHASFQQSSVGATVKTVTLTQLVHLTLRCGFEPNANFDKQRRLIACAPIP